MTAGMRDEKKFASGGRELASSSTPKGDPTTSASGCRRHRQADQSELQYPGQIKIT